MLHIYYRISCAGIAGDPSKLLVATSSRGHKTRTLFNSDSKRSLKRAIKKLKRLMLDYFNLKEAIIVPPWLNKTL